ncbi:hypothetical protein [Brevibacterium linens]|uniref:hypothetical protein n=1 Tax=Brevibacterium linens TaxID=1703 RepID=UPI0011AEFFA5|nr:hypothetical protein [Brevibacterium linens]
MRPLLPTPLNDAHFGGLSAPAARTSADDLADPAGVKAVPADEHRAAAMWSQQPPEIQQEYVERYARGSPQADEDQRRGVRPKED